MALDCCRGSALLLISALAGCGTPYSQAPSAPSEVEQKQADIGKKKWFRYAGSICESPDLQKNCRTPKTGSGATVVSVVKGGPSGIFLAYNVQLDDKSLGYISDLDFTLMDDEPAHKKLISEKADCDRRGGVRVGMTSDQVRASCWGKPTSVNRTITGASTREQWVYPGYNYVYVVDGVVSSIQTSSH